MKQTFTVEIAVNETWNTIFNGKLQLSLERRCLHNQVMHKDR